MPLGPLQRYVAFGRPGPFGPQALPLRMTPRSIALLVLVALLGGCQGVTPLARKGQERCATQVAGETNGLLRPLLYGQCLLSIDALLERERVEAQIRQQAQARKKLADCYANQADVKSLATAFQAARGRLSHLQAEAYVESERPRRLDPDLQRRYAAYDQELDQERYDSALAQWHQAESQRYQNWLAGQQRRIRVEQANLAALARRLNQINPELFMAPGSLGPPPVLNPLTYGQAIACQPEPLR